MPTALAQRPDPERGPRTMRLRRAVLALLATGVIATCGLGAAGLVGSAAALAADIDDARLRARMVDEIVAMSALPGATRAGAGVLAALGKVPRHEFVPDDVRRNAYENRPLPIGHGQTISQPYIVAAMTELLRPRPGDVVLEIGTGSGYQAAVLAELGASVYTIEIIEPLAREAAARLQHAGYGNVRTRVGDGWNGWPDAAPFDAIIVTAASAQIPPPLIRQLKPGGRMVIPVGAPFHTQQLMLVEKNADGTVQTRQMMPVRFVPFTRGP